MDIAVETVTDIVMRLRAIEVKEGNTDPDSGSNPIDDGATITMSTFGASAPLAKLQEKYGFSVDHIVEQARTLLNRAK